MKKWKNVTDAFTERQRHYKDTYLEIDEVYDEKIEVSLFSSKTDKYEIYISYGIMNGIVYADADAAKALREEIKMVLVEDYELNHNPSDEFINMFVEKYHLELPMNIFF